MREIRVHKGRHGATMRIGQAGNCYLIMREVKSAVGKRDNGNAGAWRSDSQRVHRAELAR